MRADRAFAGPLLLLSAVVVAARWATAPGVAEHFDGAAFVLGVERYSVAEHRPFAAGYPVYIWLGKLFTLGSSDAAAGLHGLSVAASTAILWALASLARAWRRASGGDEAEGRRAGFAAAVLWSASPLSWTVGTEIASDPTGLCLGAFMLWACWRSLQPSPLAWLWLLAAAQLGGWMIGARLAYATLLLPLAYAVFARRRERATVAGAWRPPLVLLALLCFALPVAIWAGWQLSREGRELLEAARLHFTGHYQSWGQSLVTDPDPWTRPARLGHTILADGFGAWWPGEAAARLLASAAAALLLLTGARRLSRASGSGAPQLALLWGLPYLAGALVSHDLSYPRYSLPLVALLCLLAGLGLPRRPGTAALVTAGLTVSMLAVSVPLALLHRDAPRLGYKLTRFAGDHLDPRRDTLLITRDGVYLDYFLTRAASSLPTEIVEPGALTARARQLEREGRQVYATAPAPEQPGDWHPVARLCRGALPADARDPDEIWIFRHSRGGRPTPFPGCS